jgi:hypothetical protein
MTNENTINNNLVKRHICKYCDSAKMQSVTYRKSTRKFYCAACGGELEDCQVDDETVKAKRRYD